LSYTIPENLPASRPARIEKVESWQYSWEGFFTGAYTFRTALTPNQLRGNVQVSEQPVFKVYMLREWLPLFFPETPGREDGATAFISQSRIRDALEAPAGSLPAYVRQTHYDMNSIEYTVSLPQPMLMVENELYFTGWTAELQSAQGSQTIQAVNVDEVFRGWHLPAGDYQMTAQFHLPWTGLFRGISLGALGAWLILLVGVLLQRRRRSMNDPALAGG
jgi:hypothetical protein